MTAFWPGEEEETDSPLPSENFSFLLSLSLFWPPPTHARVFLRPVALQLEALLHSDDDDVKVDGGGGDVQCMA